MLSRFSFMRKVRLHPELFPRLRVDVDILLGNWTLGSLSLSQSEEDRNNRPSRESDFIWNYKENINTHCTNLVFLILFGIKFAECHLFFQIFCFWMIVHLEKRYCHHCLYNNAIIGSWKMLILFTNPSHGTIYPDWQTDRKDTLIAHNITQLFEYSF